MNFHKTNKKKRTVWTIDSKVTKIRITLIRQVHVPVFHYLNMLPITLHFILIASTIAKVYSELNIVNFKTYQRKIQKICTNLKLKKEWFLKNKYRFWCQTVELSTQIINHNGLINNLWFKIILKQQSLEAQIVNLQEFRNRGVIGKILNYNKLFRDQIQMILKLQGKILRAQK
jgi:hypothetical protein